MISSIRFVGTLAAACALSACGGGSGGGDDGGPPPAASYVMVPLAPGSFPAGTSTQAIMASPSGAMQGGSRFTNIADERALIWSGTADSFVDLGAGQLKGMSEDTQVGITGVEGLGSERARMWMGSEASGVSLHPASGYVASGAWAADVGIQVGRARPTSSTTHACLWTGTAASFVDLHPTGYSNSRAYGAFAGVQVGEGARVSDGQTHALLWRSTAASVVDLGPGLAWAASSDQQVGQGAGTNGRAHALMWSGTEASRVDLHPAGFMDSRAFGVANGRQVGEGVTDAGEIHALVWSGSAASVVDLHSATQGYLIDGQPVTSSFARGIDNAGNVVGVVQSSATGTRHAVIWRPQ